MIADAGLSPCGKIGLHLGCLFRRNLFLSPKALSLLAVSFSFKRLSLLTSLFAQYKRNLFR